MKKVLLSMSAVALVSTLAACSRTEEPANDVVADDMNTMMADPNNPFAQSEMAMDRAMMAAVGISAQDSWVRKMIEHHRGAIDMSRIVLPQNPTADVAQMAQETIANQGREITDLEKLIASGTPDPASAELYRPAAMQMHSAMMAATGANISETYLRKMLAHHQGAVAMSDVALANGASGAVRAQIEKTKASQQKEIAMVEAMLLWGADDGARCSGYRNRSGFGPERESGGGEQARRSGQTSAYAGQTEAGRACSRSARWA